jgi:glycosyltransferase involved in cell wall biosynthesis
LTSSTRVVHIISGLGVGGAERSLLELLRVMDRRAFESTVVSLSDAGPVAESIRELGIGVSALGMSRSRPSPFGLAGLARAVRRLRPDVVQTWMYHADLLGGLAARIPPATPAAWGIRHSDFAPETTSVRTLRVVRLCAALSRALPARIVCCSHVARRIHEEMGYDAAKMLVIPNGFDLGVFRPDPAARDSVRAELGVPRESVLIGAVGRYHPQKDHANLIAAAGILVGGGADVHFVMCGDGIDDGNRELAELLARGGIARRAHLLGRRDDVERIFASLDIATSSSSYGEASPRVVGEAMASGVPCAVTDVGDSAIIVGDTGRVVEPRNASALAAAWDALLALGPDGRRRLGETARARVREHYDIRETGACFGALYEELAGRSDRTGRSS